MFAAIVTALILSVSPLKMETQEYCVVTKIEAVDAETDIVTVQKGNGKEYAFYADACSYAVPEYVNVTFDTLGRIVLVN